MAAMGDLRLMWRSKSKKWNWCRLPSAGDHPIPKNCIWLTSRSSWIRRAASPCRSLARRAARPAHSTSQKKGFVTHFKQDICSTCPFFEKGQCPAQPGKRDKRHHLRFTQAQAQTFQRRRRSQAYKKVAGNLRSAVEATVRSVKHPFPAAKLPVRGLFRVACMVIGSAAITNVRRIERYLKAKNQKKAATMAASTG